MEGWESMFNSAMDSNFGIQFDLKKFYFHVPINEKYKKYFGFSFKMADNEEPSYFIFNTMPYGYTRAPFIAKNLVKPLVIKWRKMNISIGVFFDDGFSVSKDKDFMKKCSIQIQCDLLRAGFIPGLEKCFWKPQTELDWIGLKWNFDKKGISIITRRVQKFKEKLHYQITNWPDVTYRDIASVTGILNSLYPVLDGREQLRSRFLQNFVNMRHFNEYPWDSKIKIEIEILSKMAKNELVFWNENIDRLNFRPFVKDTPMVLGWADASKNAIGGIVTSLNDYSLKNYCLSIDNLRNKMVTGNCSRLNIHTDNCGSVKDEYKLDFYDIKKFTFFHRMLNSYEIKKDSNERELIAAKETIFGAVKMLKNSTLTIHFDNSTAAKVMSKGSSKLRLQTHALQMDNFCLEHNIKLNCVNIPRDLNSFADELSKITDYEDYSVNDLFLSKVLDDIEYIPTIDRFADNYNAKFPVFNSKTFCIGSTGVNAFNYDWGPDHINWIFPPPRLLMKSLNQLKYSKGIGIFLTPEWKGSDFYPFFCSHYKFCKKFIRYSGQNVFKHGADKDSYFGPNFNCAVNIWMFDFKYFKC